MELNEFLRKYMFEENNVLGIDCYTTDLRVSHDDVPDGWHLYETRMDDDLDDYYGTLEKHVVVNYGVAVLFPCEIDLGEKGYIEFEKVTW